MFCFFEPPTVLCGVGLRLTENYPPRAVEILPRRPAGICGLILIGDVFAKIDGRHVTDKSMDFCRSMIAGPEGTMVTFEFWRDVRG